MATALISCLFMAQSHVKLLPPQRTFCVSQTYYHVLVYSLFIQSHICRVHVCLAVTCHLHFCLHDRDLLRAAAVTGGTDTEIRVSTESGPWRRNFSRNLYRDSNPRPFDHDSGALTTELSPLPVQSVAVPLFRDSDSTANGCARVHSAFRNPRPPGIGRYVN